MADRNPELDVFDGIEVQEGTIPGFLKLTYIGFVIFGISYWFLYRAGDAGQPLVALLNAATGH
jgi:hypothetical protein